MLHDLENEVVALAPLLPSSSHQSSYNHQEAPGIVKNGQFLQQILERAGFTQKVLGDISHLIDDVVNYLSQKR